MPLPFLIYLDSPRQSLLLLPHAIATGSDFVVAADGSYYSSVGYRCRCGDVYRDEGIERQWRMVLAVLTRYLVYMYHCTLRY